MWYIRKIYCHLRGSYSRGVLQSFHNMPKEHPELEALRILRKNKKESILSPSTSGRICISVLSNGSPECDPALLLQTDHMQMLFNCGESVQRICFANSVKITKLEHIMLTQAKWKNIGGVLGISLTLQNMGIPGLTVHSSFPMKKFYNMTQGFSHSKSLDVTEKTHLNNDKFENCDVSIKYVPIEGKNGLSTGEFKRFRTRNLPVLCYLGKLTSVPGTLDFRKCMEFKVPRGPMLAELKNGQDVTLEDGTIVKSSDVRGPNQPGVSFFIVDCPSIDYLESLATHNLLQPFYCNVDTSISHVFHFTPYEVTQNDEYKAWMKKFPEHTIHVMLNEKNIGSPNVGPGILQEKLRLVDTDIFPPLNLSSNAEELNIYSNNILHPLPMTKIDLRPKLETKAFSLVNVPAYMPGSYKGIVLELPDVKENIAEYKEKISSLPSSDKEKYPCVSFIGTASALPGKERNTSSIWIDLNEESSIMFDCAEGTLSQLVRLFGPELDDNLRKLKSIFISHLHADHHIGLIGLIQRRKKVTNEPVILFLPQPVINWLTEYNAEFEEIDECYKIINNTSFMGNSTPDTDFLMKLGLKNLTTCRVKHCRESFGVTITSSNNFKIVYSGDAMPSNNLVIIGNNADLLIHEATMEDELEEDAVVKCHSTVSQAIEIGRQMNAKNIILTHFSQRYAKIPIISEDVLKNSTNVSCAFDNMKIRKCDLLKLPLQMNALKAIFEKHETKMLLKTKRRKMKEKFVEELLQKEESSSKTCHLEVESKN